MFWNTTKIQTVYEWIFFYVKTTPYLRENNPAPSEASKRPGGSGCNLCTPSAPSAKPAELKPACRVITALTDL
jgi:hypothetical protein